MLNIEKKLSPYPTILHSHNLFASHATPVIKKTSFIFLFSIPSRTKQVLKILLGSSGLLFCLFELLSDLLEKALVLFITEVLLLLEPFSEECHLLRVVRVVVVVDSLLIVLLWYVLVPIMEVKYVDMS